jgi:DNA-binding MarR family transcriptional regulator
LDKEVGSMAGRDTNEGVSDDYPPALLDMTASNLSTHLRKLEDASYVQITKAHQRRTPVTYVALTEQGQRAFADYTTTKRALLTAPTDQFGD